jgi:arylsulfatase A-like enzyme
MNISKGNMVTKTVKTKKFKFTTIALTAAGLFNSFAMNADAYANELQKPKAGNSRPNFVVIVTDDMGYSDLSCFGSEIETPNICALAERGSMITDYYTNPMSAPTRAMLLTGVDNHLTGFGSMPPLRSANQMGMPGYEGQLNQNVITIGEMLKPAGYDTYFAGKWHLGETPDTTPQGRGFTSSFAFTGGGVSHWADQLPLNPFEEPNFFYVEDGKKVAALPNDFYSSVAFTDKIINWTKQGSGRPFYAQLAFTAPHDPLHAPDDWIAKYMGKYDKGYDVLRQERLARLKKMGLVDQSTELSKGNPEYKPWSALTPEEQKRSAKTMAIYAAMVANLDHQVGRLVQHLKDTGQYENTYFIYTHDNGPNPKPAANYTGNTPKFMGSFDNSYENMGRPNSFVSYDAGWAEAGSTPFSFYKSTMGEGGVRVPLIVSGPNVKVSNNYVSSGGAVVADIVPTILDIVGVKQPETRRGVKVSKINGKSWKPFLTGKSKFVRSKDDGIATELHGYRLYVKDGWKIRRMVGPHRNVAGGNWELFNISKDPSELINLAEKNPAKLQELVSLYDAYSKTVGVVEKMPPYPTLYHRQTWSLRQDPMAINPYQARQNKAATKE